MHSSHVTEALMVSSTPRALAKDRVYEKVGRAGRMYRMKRLESQTAAGDAAPSFARQNHRGCRLTWHQVRTQCVRARSLHDLRWRIHRVFG